MSIETLGIGRVGSKRYAFAQAGTYHFTIRDIGWGSLKDFKLTIERPDTGELDARECLIGQEEHFDFGVDVRSGDELAIWVKHAMDAYKEGVHGSAGNFDATRDGVEFYSEDFRVILDVA